MSYERNFDLINNKFKDLFFPTLISSIAGNFAIMVDAFFISLFLGSMFLSVVQTMEPFVSFINVLYWLIGLGGSVVCTVARAEFDTQRSNSLFTVSIVTVVLLAFIVVVSSILFQDTFVGFLCHSAELQHYVSQYFSLYVLGIVFECYMVSLAYFIRTDGFIQLQFRAFLLANMVNVILDVVFMKFMGMGIPGAALATSIGSITAAAYISVYFFKNDRTLKFIRVKSSEVMSLLVEICRAGLSVSSMPLYSTIRLFVLNTIILALIGNIGLVTFNACYNTQHLVNIFVLGTVQSILPIVSVYFKEQDYHGVGNVINNSKKIAVGFGIIFTALFTIYPDIILFIFNINNPTHVPIVKDAIRIFSLSFVAFAVNNLYIFYAQAIQDDKLANIITLLEYLVFPVVLMYVFTSIWGKSGIWISLVASELATVLFLLVYSIYVNRKSGGEYSGFFINRTNKENPVYEFTIHGDVTEAVNISRNMEDKLGNDKLSKIVRMAVEDMIVYIIDINEYVDLIDVIVRNDEEYLLISIKYSGIPINPTVTVEPYSNISILRKIAENIDYSEILGLNNTVITINKHRYENSLRINE